MQSAVASATGSEPRGASVSIAAVDAAAPPRDDDDDDCENDERLNEGRYDVMDAEQGRRGRAGGESRRELSGRMVGGVRGDGDGLGCTLSVQI